MTREPQLNYQYLPDEIGELNMTIDELRAEVARLTAIIAEHETLFDRLPRLRDHLAALEPKPCPT